MVHGPLQTPLPNAESETTPRAQGAKVNGLGCRV